MMPKRRLSDVQVSSEGELLIPTRASGIHPLILMSEIPVHYFRNDQGRIIGDVYVAINDVIAWYEKESKYPSSEQALNRHQKAIEVFRDLVARTTVTETKVIVAPAVTP